MRFLLPSLVLCLCLSLPTLAGENKPNPRLTPGEVATTDIALVCQHGYSKSVRHTTSEMKRAVYAAYGIKRPHKTYKIDHLVPLSLGGADSLKNIWPSDFKAASHTAADKDRLELKVRDLVCHKEMSVGDGQKLFLTDWQKAYDRYCPTRTACPSYMEIQDMIKAREALRQSTPQHITKENAHD